jgi:predicted MPP superfamily phosphohydrolase
MRKLYSFAIFFSVVLLISFAINFYVLSRLYDLFKIKKGLIFWIAVLVCSVSLIASSILRSHFDNIISRVFYVIAANWLGILWLLFSVLIIYEIVRVFIKINPAMAGIVILTIVGLAVIYAMINAQLVRVKELVIPGDADLNIVQISDIHLGSTGEKFLQRIIKKTNTLKPDVVVITGDIADSYNERTQKSLVKLGDLKADIFFVTGNHEMYAGSEKAIKALTQANVRVLCNQLVNYNQIQIIGIDESTNLHNLGQILGQLNIDECKFCVLLSHRPVEPKMLSDMKIDLALAGHSHGGQIFPFNFIVRFYQKYLSGLYRYNNSYLYVTTGTGTWGPRMRLGSRSEIVLIKVRKASF